VEIYTIFVVAVSIRLKKEGTNITKFKYEGTVIKRALVL
jgi:hypothetical protein